MWNFLSPRIVFGEGALDALEELKGQRALVVTDVTMIQMGLLDKVKAGLERAGFRVHVFDQVEPDPSVETARQGAQMAQDVQPDWIVGLGGGSPIDAAKAIWVLYERPDIEPDAIGPVGDLGLRKKARLITIPTTSGTGAEVTWGIVLTDTTEKRKMGLGHPENIADIAIIDPEMAAGMPPQLTADTGLDTLVHAVEGYTCTWHTDLTDGLCLHAARLVFEYLPRAVSNGRDMEARERMHNAAACAGLGFGNAMASMAHAMGHSLGSAFHIPHGRAVAVFLPYTVEYFSSHAPERFAELAALAGFANAGGEQGAREFANHIRSFCRQIGNPTSISETGIARQAYDEQLDKLADNALNDTQMVTAVRAPTSQEIRKLFLYAYDGQMVDF